MLRSYALALPFALALAPPCCANDCNVPTPEPSATVALPGSPFDVVPTRDGCWLFVSLTGAGRGATPGIAVLSRSAGKVQLARVVPLPSSPAGLALSRDGKLLVAAANSATIFMDARRLIDGKSEPVLGSFRDGPRDPGSVYVNITRDNKLLFVSEESAQSITAIDLKRARSNGYKADAIAGSIPTGGAPIALTFSRNGKWLYTTSQAALPDWKWPNACKPEGLNVPDSIVTRPEGAVIVIDVGRARKDPAHAVAARIPAGCSPVRMAISSAGDRIYVTARNSNAVLAFDTAKLLTDSAHAQVAMAPAGDAPVPVIVVDKGSKVLAGNSNRFAAGNDPQTLVVFDAGKITQGLSAVEGVIAVGAFPREMAVSSDKRTLFLTNFGSKTLQVVDIARLPIDKNLPPEIAAHADAIAHRNERRQIALDAKTLNRLAGVYRSPEGRPLLIRVDGNQLAASLGISLETTLIPASETTFIVRIGQTIEFPSLNPASEEKANQVTLHNPGRNVTATRLDDSAAQLYLDAEANFAARFKQQTAAAGTEAAARRMLADLETGKLDADMMTSPTLVDELMPQLQRQAPRMGKIDSLTFQRVGAVGWDIYLIKSANGTWEFGVVLSPDGKVEQAYLAPIRLPGN